MRKNQKEKKALAIVLSVMILVFVAGVCGIYLYSQTGESQDQPQVAVKKEADSETDAMPDAGVYYYKDIDEKWFIERLHVGLHGHRKMVCSMQIISWS